MSGRVCDRATTASLVIGEAPSDDVLGVVEPGPGEPLRAGHRSRRQHLRRCDRRADLEVVPQRLPERFELGDRPPVESVVVGELESTRATQPVHVPPHPAGRPRVGTRGPQQGRRVDGCRGHRSRTSKGPQADGARGTESSPQHPSVAGLGSLGRPRTRSATMLRWIWLVPPQIVSEREKKNAVIIGDTG